MVRLSMVHVELLNYLVKNDVMDIDSLTSLLRWSLRKCQMEIKELNTIFVENNIDAEIKNKRGDGYYLHTGSKYVRKEIEHQTNQILEHTLIRSVYSKPRIAELIRTLLFAKGSIKAETLANMFNISLGTLTSDLRDVREHLEMYDITLRAVPYYGLEVCGSKMHQLSATIDLFDWNNDTRDYVIAQDNLNEIDVDLELMEKTKQSVLLVLKKHNYILTPSGFRRIIILLELLNLPKYQELGLTELARFDEYVEASIAKELVTDEKNMQHVYCVAYYLLANIDVSSKLTEKTHFNLYKGSKRTYRSLVSQLKSEVNLDLEDAAEVFNGFIVYLMKFIVRKNFNILEFNTLSSLVEVVRKLPATQALTIKIISLLKGTPNQPLNDAMFYELAILIYNYAYSNGSEYDPVRVLLINDFSLYANKSIISHLNMDRFSMRFDHIPSYQYHDEDFSKYDCIITTSTLMHDIDANIPVFKQDYFGANTIVNDLWSKFLMGKRKSTYVVDQLSEKICIQIRESEVSLASRILQTLKAHNIEIKDGFEQIRLMMSHQKGWTVGSELTICLLWDKKASANVFIFELIEAIEVNHALVQRINVIVLNPYGRMLSIKQADSSIKRSV